MPRTNAARYLPPGYDDNPDKRYRHFTCLAGHGGSGPLMLARWRGAKSFQERIDRLISSGAMEPVIAVLPDCWTIFWRRTIHQLVGAGSI